MVIFLAGPNANGTRFIEQPTEHVKRTHPYTDPDFWGNKNYLTVSKKMNRSIELDVVPVKRLVAFDKRLAIGKQFTLVYKYSTKIKFSISVIIYISKAPFHRKIF